MMPPVRRVPVPPRASVLIESMRDIGYSLQTAVADIIDNSITAGARNIHLLANTTAEQPAIGILDDGSGMGEQELIEAMRPGSRSPLDPRCSHDLGRFGLGLKTASFSQCRRVTVLTRKNGRASCAIWDLDTVAKADEWVVDITDDYAKLPWSDRLQQDGTLVIWHKLDRLVEKDGHSSEKYLIRQLDETATHIELVFHRFLSGDGCRKVAMTINGRPLEPFDPFNSKDPATVYGPEETFGLGDHQIRFQVVTLPHHKKMTPTDWDRYAGTEGYIKNQGFYVYRGGRLIIYGTWFNLTTQSELKKLARVKVDIPNGVDTDWKIDVKKASAQPPPAVRDRLRRIVNDIGGRSKRVYVNRGSTLWSSNRLPVWRRSQDKNQIIYGINLEHPAFQSFSTNLVPELQREFHRLLELVGATMPMEVIYADIGSNPASTSSAGLTKENLSEVTRTTYQALIKSDYSEEEVIEMMSSAEPFRSNMDLVKATVKQMRKGRNLQ